MTACNYYSWAFYSRPSGHGRSLPLAARIIYSIAEALRDLRATYRPGWLVVCVRAARRPRSA